MKNNYLINRPEEWHSVVARLYNRKCLNITFQVTEDCCMKCTYCYQHNKKSNKMDFETAKSLIDDILSLDPNLYSSVIFEFIGGEPFLEIELIEKICDYTINKMIEMHHPWLICFRCSMCSNGILYTSPKV
jgi:sulfatase maturation enzyme AslB (radical SAM superfamily)